VPLNRNLTERLPATVGRMIRSYPKEVTPVLDEQLLAQMALWSWVVVGGVRALGNPAELPVRTM
jgi:hypothetical protein